MGIRESLNENPGIATGATIGVILIALVMIVLQVWPTNAPTGAISEMFYTVDDGATWFPDDGIKYAPFDHQGKQAVRVYVFSCDENKTKFVGYLERLSPDAKAQLESAGKKGKPDDSLNQSIIDDGSEVKRPGESTWVKRASAEGERIISPTCPDGNTTPTIVLPGD